MITNKLLERACRQLARRERVNPDKWYRYVTIEDREKVGKEIDRIAFKECTLSLLLVGAVVLTALIFGASSP